MHKYSLIVVKIKKKNKRNLKKKYKQIFNEIKKIKNNDYKKYISQVILYCENIFNKLIK